MPSVLVIGGHGMLGRPVVRRLLQEGFSVRVLARSPEKARALLPQNVDVRRGDLQDTRSIDAALDGCGAVYVSVDTHPKASFRPETQGLTNVVVAAKNHKARLLVLSALGQSDPQAPQHHWWHVREKAEAQKIARESKLPWTIFEPPWFMESLPLFARKGKLTMFSGVTFSSYWISGDDYGRIVAAALAKNEGIEEIVRVQGPQAVDFMEAAQRFANAYGGLRLNRVPFWVLRLAGLFNAQADDLATLLRIYADMDEPMPDTRVWERFARPEMTIERYAAYCRDTGDFPQKV